jgi:hypothetical protein
MNDRPAYRVMDSRADARVAILDVIRSAKQELAVFDRTPVTLAERDFGRPETIDMMRDLLVGGRQRRLRIVLHEVSGIESELPRLISLLGQFGSQVAIHQSRGAAREVEDVLLLADDHSVWRKPVYSHPRSVAELGDAVAVRAYVDRFEEIWEGSELAVSERSTGL